VLKKILKIKKTNIDNVVPLPLPKKDPRRINKKIIVVGISL
tara:strand:- start:52 stop:174 length:123 start_codon:yes stop_codon:yes gene_type:complete